MSCYTYLFSHYFLGIKIAGFTTEYVNKILDKFKGGGNSITYSEDR